VTKLSGKVKSRSRRKKNIEQKNRLKRYKTNLISKIKTFNDPVLLEECNNIEEKEILSSIIQDNLKLMGKVLAATETGVGLAAPQIGFTKRIFALRPDPKVNDISFFINPEIIEYSKEKQSGIEGCLSYPDVFVPVERYKDIKIKYLDREGNKKIKKFDEKESVIVQHELEHFLFGPCFVGEAWKKGKFKVEKEIKRKGEKKKNELSKVWGKNDRKR